VSHLQYGVYLIPPPELIGPLRAAQELMSSQFGTQIATRFMVHCTIKGFFKLADGASPTDFTPALDTLYSTTGAFDVEFERLWLSPPGRFGASLLQMLRNTEMLQRLHEQTWAAVAPFIAADCPFSHREPSGPNFAPHITLVQADLPNEPGLREQGHALGQYLFDNLPSHRFVARTMQLVEFSSEDWYGQWSPSLRWRLLEGWTLAN
jgi:2'-5' RNA ligase